MKKKLLSVVIVSFNTSDLLQKCLESVKSDLASAGMNASSEIIIVDNASKDDSVKAARKICGNALIIRNSKNLGFAGANNIGIKKAGGKYILLLNSDTEVKIGALSALLAEIRTDKRIGAAGGMLLNHDGSIQQSAGYFPHLSRIFFWMFFVDDLPGFSKYLLPYHVTDLSFYRKMHEVDWVSGACFIFDKDIIKTAGLMDEKIFMYGEELEWCYRIKKQGFKIYYTPGARIYHTKGASAEKDRNTAGIMEEIKSLLYFYGKHKSGFEREAALFLIRCGALLRIVLFAIIRRYSFRVPIYAKIFKMVG